ncbi:MAG: hypothetical protein IPG45_21610 [Deltaproteobacteria bacterium]|nr:hypothetical protein [Deltaproteobacteria bacterium]
MAARPDFHEAAPDEALVVASDRSFGVVMAVAFGVVGGLPLLRGGEPRLWSLGLAVAFGLTTAVRPSLLHPLNVVWAHLGALLNKIVSPLVLGAMFFLVITPMGLYQRARGRDLLRLKRDAASPSYWIPRDPPGPAPESMRNQF